MGVFCPGQLLGPRGGAPECETATNNLVGALGLTVCLGMETGGEAGRGSDKVTELLPKQGRELRTPIGDDVRGETMDLKYPVDYNLGRLLRGREFGKKDKVGGLRKAVDDSKDYRVPLRRGEASNKIQADV